MEQCSVEDLKSERGATIELSTNWHDDDGFSDNTYAWTTDKKKIKETDMISYYVRSILLSFIFLSVPLLRSAVERTQLEKFKKLLYWPVS